MIGRETENMGDEEISERHGRWRDKWETERGKINFILYHLLQYRHTSTTTL